FRKASGERYDSGTEWELEMAFEAYEQSLSRTRDSVAAKPDIVIYRRNQPPPHFKDPDQQAQSTTQITRLEAYFRHNYWFPDGTIKRPITNYATLDEFEAVLFRNLEELILRQIPSLKPGFEPPPISGSPFKGLQAFNFSDSDRYFGRNREIREIQQRLIASARNGLPFILIYGGSGYGKSSLMRAGLAPVLVRPGGSLEEIQGWRRLPFQPAKGEGPLTERLARAFLQVPTEEETARSRQHNHWPLPGLAELQGEAHPKSPSSPEWDSASLSRHFADDEQRPLAIAAMVKILEALNRHLLLEIDQLEEIFTTPGIDDVQRTAFLCVVGDLALSLRIWVVATMRSEFFPRIAEQAELFRLVGKDRGYILPPPDHQSLKEIIRYPVLAARLNFERRVEEMKVAGVSAKTEYLDDQILEDAGSSPDALPLLEFTLQELYESRRDNLLTWSSYAASGGLKGAIAQRATHVYQRLAPVAQLARHRIFAALVHIDPVRNTVTRQRAPLASLQAGPGAQAFVSAFLENHLLVTDEDMQTGLAVITLAHEALISHWGELAGWIQEHQGDLLARQRFREQTNLWLQNDRKKAYLLSEARLAEAQRVAQRELFTLSAEERRCLQLSEELSRKKLRVLQFSLAVFAIVALVAVILGIIARQKMQAADLASKESSRQTTIAQAAQEKSKEQLKEASRVSVGVALDHRDKNDDPGMVLAHLLKALSYSPENELAQIQALSVLLQSAHRFRRFPVISLRHDEPVASAKFSADGRWVVTAASDPNKSVFSARVWNVAAGKSVGEPMLHEGIIVSAEFSPDGRRVVTASKDNTARLWDAATGKPLGESLDHEEDVTSAVFSADGHWVLTASKDDTARVWDATTGKPAGPPLLHEGWVSDAAFSTDGRWVVTASRDKTARVWEAATGKPVSTLAGHEEALTSAVFSPDGRWVVTASEDDGARIWEAATGKQIGETMPHKGSVVSVAFSADGRWVLTASKDNTARIWTAATGKPAGEPLRHEEEVQSAAFSADTRWVVTASLDNTVRLWDTTTGEPVGEPLLHGGEGVSAEFSADGRWVLTASGDKRVQIWNAASGKTQALDVNEPIVADSADGRWVVVTSSDLRSQVLNVATGVPVGEPMRGVQHVS
ncbi:MAG: hypothetical protein Q8M07_00435, partial [Prosthecobacter sp.]|nr:hypothetical protein [Prosthecobacter sp.]